jgi:LysM repeat protein
MSTSEIKKYLAIFDEPVVQQDKQYVLTEAARVVAPVQKASQKMAAMKAKTDAKATSPSASTTAPKAPTTATKTAPSAPSAATAASGGRIEPTMGATTSSVAGSTTSTAPSAAAPASAAPAAPAATMEPAQDTGKNNIFQNPKLFQDAWAKYTASKPNYQLISDPKMLEVLKSLWMQMGGTKLQESVYLKERDMLIESIARKHPIYESMYDATRYLCEADLSQEQIQQVFKAVADGAAKGMNIDKEGDAPSSNRTFLGKGADVTSDVAKKVSGAWNNLKSAIADSGPMDGFNVTVDSLQNQIMSKLGGKGGAIGQALTAYRKFGKEHPVMQGVIYGLFTTALATVTGATGGMALPLLAFGLRTADKLLQGDKASSALWSGFKAGALAGAGHALFQHLSDLMQSGPHGATGKWDPSQGSSTSTHTNLPTPTGDEGSGATIPNFDPAGATQYIAQANDSLSKIAEKFHISVQELKAWNPDLSKNPDLLNAGYKLQIPPATGSSVYQGGVGTALNTWNDIQSGAAPFSQISANQAAKYGLRTESIKENKFIDWKRTVKSMKLAESKGRRTYTLYVTESGRKEVFRVVHEGIWSGIKTAAKKGWDSATNKITFDKLDMHWRRNYGDNPVEGSVDVDKVREFLKSRGVKDYLINYALSQIGIGVNQGQQQGQDQQGQDQQGQDQQGQPQKSSFVDPNSLRSEWEKFTDSGASVAPGVKGVLKDILQTALKTVQEDIEYFKFVSLLK